MYALKPPTPTQQPQQGNRTVRRAKPRKRTHPYQAIAYETTAKLMVNVVLSVAAVTALVQLLPYKATQLNKVQELDAALKSTGERVEGVQNRFQNYFDPYQARENMQELTDRIDPNRRRIIWKSAPVSAQPAPQPQTEVPVNQP